MKSKSKAAHSLVVCENCETEFRLFEVAQTSKCPECRGCLDNNPVIGQASFLPDDIIDEFTAVFMTTHDRIVFGLSSVETAMREFRLSIAAAERFLMAKANKVLS